VQDALNSVAKFVTKYPREVVIVDFNHFYGMTQQLHLELIKMIHETFGDALASRKRTPTSPLREFWEAGVR
jgi:hypothetical protein